MYMKTLVALGTAALLLTACAPAPVLKPGNPATAKEPAASESGEATEPTATASAESPRAEASVESSPSADPSASAGEPGGPAYEVPADDPDNEAARIVVALDDEESAVTVGPQSLGPDFTVSAQCRGPESLKLELYDDAAEVESAEAFMTIDVPCGEPVVQDESLDDHPASVRPMFVGDVAEAEAWATITNGVG